MNSPRFAKSLLRREHLIRRRSVLWLMPEHLKALERIARRLKVEGSSAPLGHAVSIVLARGFDAIAETEAGPSPRSNWPRGEALAEAAECASRLDEFFGTDSAEGHHSIEC